MMTMKKNTFRGFLGTSFLVHAAFLAWLAFLSPHASPRGEGVMAVTLVSPEALGKGGEKQQPRAARSPGQDMTAPPAGPRPAPEGKGSAAPVPMAPGAAERTPPSTADTQMTGAPAGGNDPGYRPDPDQPGSGAMGASLQSYNRLVVGIISKNRFYPVSARRRGIEGSVDVRLTIDGTGRASDVRVVKTSGAGILDRASVQTIRGCSFPPPPAESVTLPITITFRLVEESQS